ncbi:MAG: hypothetical protein QOH40_822, partial [Arthrobacter pascens]|nr:hypothetical protein [Arthrobacter pascens]
MAFPVNDIDSTSDGELQGGSLQSVDRAI